MLRGDVKKYYGSVIGMAGRGEGIAGKENYCEIDPTTVDQFGIPVLKFNYNWSDLEVKRAKHMQDTFEEIIHNMGGEALGDKPTAENDYGLLAPGRIIHEVVPQEWVKTQKHPKPISSINCTTLTMFLSLKPDRLLAKRTRIVLGPF